MRIAVLRAVLATLVCGGLGAGCVARTTPAAKSNDAVASGPVAKVDGQPIYDDDLLPAIRSQLQQLRTQEYQIKSQDRKSTRLNSSHRTISYAVFCLKKK